MEMRVTVTIRVPENVVQDGVSNGNTASLTKRVAVDREDPTVVSITAPSDPQNGDFPVTITFSEPVYGFESSELMVTQVQARFRAGVQVTMAIRRILGP